MQNCCCAHYCCGSFKFCLKATLKPWKSPFPRSKQSFHNIPSSYMCCIVTFFLFGIFKFSKLNSNFVYVYVNTCVKQWSQEVIPTSITVIPQQQTWNVTPFQSDADGTVIKNHTVVTGSRVSDNDIKYFPIWT